MALLRYLWAAPNTAIGLVLATVALLTRGRASLHSGVLEVRGGLIGWCLRNHPFVPGGAAAMTLGHVVVGVHQHALDRTRLHERVHVAQYERWGPFFLPAYFISSGLCAARGQDPYRDNAFERPAFAADAAAAEAARSGTRTP